MQEYAEYVFKTFYCICRNMHPTDSGESAREESELRLGTGSPQQRLPGPPGRPREPCPNRPGALNRGSGTAAVAPGQAPGRAYAAAALYSGCQAESPS